MKCAIFLLALCAFQTVFADEQFKERLENLRNEKMKQMQDILDSLSVQVEDAIADGVKNGLNHEIQRECWEDYWKLFDYHKRNKKFGKYDHCFWTALRVSDIKFAEACIAENIKLLEGKEQESRFHTRECIAKHYVKHLGAGQQHPAILL